MTIFDDIAFIFTKNKAERKTKRLKCSKSVFKFKNSDSSSVKAFVAYSFAVCVDLFYLMCLQYNVK